MAAWVTSQDMSVDRVVAEVGPALNGHLRKFLALARDRSVTRIVVGNRTSPPRSTGMEQRAFRRSVSD